MIETIEGVKVEQTHLSGVPEKICICPDCGRVKHSNRKCRGDRMKRIIKRYNKMIYEEVMSGM